MGTGCLEGKLGNCMQSPFLIIWSERQYIQVRADTMGGLASIASCQNYVNFIHT